MTEQQRAFVESVEEDLAKTPVFERAGFDPGDTPSEEQIVSLTEQTCQALETIPLTPERREVLLGQVRLAAERAIFALGKAGLHHTGAPVVPTAAGQQKGAAVSVGNVTTEAPSESGAESSAKIRQASERLLLCGFLVVAVGLVVAACAVKLFHTSFMTGISLMIVMLILAFISWRIARLRALQNFYSIVFSCITVAIWFAASVFLFSSSFIVAIALQPALFFAAWLIMRLLLRLKLPEEMLDTWSLSSDGKTKSI